MQNNQHQIVLASSSKIRSVLLKKAGLNFTVHPADIDEDKIRDGYLALPGPHMDKLAQTLSDQKAKAVSLIYPGKYVIGADQLLVLDNQIFSKPGTFENTKTQLKQLCGKTHLLISAVSVVKDGKNLWSYAEQAQMQMREFSQGFLDQYIQNCAEPILSCVGGYQLEGAGAQLFHAVKGDYFTVLGLPLIPLLEFFRTRNILIS